MKLALFGDFADFTPDFDLLIGDFGRIEGETPPETLMLMLFIGEVTSSSILAFYYYYSL